MQRHDLRSNALVMATEGNLGTMPVLASLMLWHDSPGEA
jgi:hypothetical protein